MNSRSAHRNLARLLITALAALLGLSWANNTQAAVWSFTNKNDTAWSIATNWNPNTVPPSGVNNYPGRFNVGAGTPGHATNVTLIYDSPLTTGFGTIINAAPEYGRGLSVANGSGTFATLRIVNGTLNIYQAALIDAAIVCAPANSVSTSQGHLLLDGGNLAVIATNYGVLSFPFRGNSNSLGMVTVQNGSTLKVDRLRFGGTGAFNDIGVDLPGVLNLNSGGTVHMRNIGNLLRPENLRATNNFNGGTIKVLAAESAGEGRNPLIGSNIVNNILTGGLVVDTDGFAARIMSPLLHGSAGIDGGITKTGGGSLRLGGLGSTYTGPTIVSNGSVSVQVPMVSTDFRVATGAGLNFITDNAAPWSLPSLGLTNASLGFDYGNFASYNNAVVSVGNLNLQGTIAVNLIGTSFPVTTLTLLTYTGKSGPGAFALGSLPTGAQGTLVDTGSALILNITAASLQALTWTPYFDSNWTTNGLPNWNFGTATYLEYPAGVGDIVTFDDNFGGTVNLPSIVRPTSMLVSVNTGEYTFTGPGGISGPTGFDKEGTSSVRVSTSNDFSGPVLVDGGTFIVDHPNALGLTNNGTTVALNATLQIGALSGNGVAVAPEPVIINGPGVGGARGALRGGATALFTTNVWSGPIVIGDATARIGTEDGGNLTISGSIYDGGFSLPVLFRPGANSTMVISGVTNTWNGDTTVFGSDQTSLVLLGAANTFPTNSRVFLGGACVLDMGGFNQTLAGLSLAAGGNTSPTTVSNGVGSAALTINSISALTYPGDIVGNLSMVIQGTNSQTLSGANLAYTGATLVAGGRLDLTTPNSMVSSITVAGSGTLGGEATTTGSLVFNANANLVVDPTTPGSFTANTIDISATPIFVTFTAPPSATEPTLVLTATTPLTGSPANLQSLSTRGGTFSFANGNTQIVFVPGASAVLTWKGNSVLNPTFWDGITTNWLNGSNPDRFFVGDSVLFNDSATSFAVAVQAPSVAPGTVTFNNSANPYTLSGAPITGGAAIEKTGTGSLTLSSANSYSGQTTIKDGTVILQNNTALGTVAGGTTVTNTGTLDVGGMNIGAEILTISGGGVAGNGAVVNNSGVDQINAVQQLVLAGNATLGGNARWDLRGSGNALDMGGFTLTKTDTNQVALVGTSVNNPGNIMVAQGIFGLHLSTYLNGSSANTITIQSGAALNFYQSPAQEWTLVLNNGSTYWSSVGGPGQNDWNGPVSIQGDVTLLANSPCQFFGNVSGPGSIIKTGTATTTLSGSNSYGGNTTVNQGTLVISQPTLATASTVTVAANAALQLDFPTTNTVAALKINGVSRPPSVYNSTTDPGYLAGTGSLLVTSSLPPTLGFTRSGNSLQFSWDGSFKLQAQTNSLSVGLGSNWADYPGGSTSPVSVPVDPAQGSVFFRLVSP